MAESAKASHPTRSRREWQGISREFQGDNKSQGKNESLYLCKHTTNRTMERLFVAEGHKWIDRGGAAGGEQAGGEAHQHDNGYDGDKCPWIGR